MAKMNIQKLRGMGFKEESIAPWGPCVKVPQKKFVAEWEQDLMDQGFPIVQVEILGEQFTLVRLETKPDEEVLPKPKSEDTRKSVHRDFMQTDWDPKEEEQLITLWNQRPVVSIQDIANKFSTRTYFSVYAKIVKLQKAGTIKHRYKAYKHYTRKSAAAKHEETTKPEKTTEPEKLVQPIKPEEAEVLRDLVNIVEKMDLLRATLDDLAGLTRCAELMHMLEERQRQGKLIVPSSIRDMYVKVLEPEPSLEILGTFRSRATAFLEACK